MRSIVMGYRFALVLVFVAGCKFKDNTLYCEGHPDDPDCSTHSDGPNTCSDTSQCTTPTGVCDLDVGMCVQCTTSEAQACMGTTPVCTNDACVACTSNAQCSDSDVCLPDGSCAAPDDVAYVAQGGGGTACSKAAPCGTLANGLGANKSIVKIASGLVKDNKTTTIDGKAVTIIADPGAKLDRDGDGAIILVQSAGANVTIVDLEVTGQTGVSDAAIDVQPNGGAPALSLIRVTVDSNQGVGISASGGSLSVSQSTISGNTGGGISVMNATFAIVGNVFFNNGANLATVGGLSITTTQSASNRLEFNSFNSNQAQTPIGCAIQCVAGTFTARNNILSGNVTGTNMEQVNTGGCSHTHSIVRPGTLPSGTGNSVADPLFANVTTGDLHIAPTSPARHAADPASDLTGIAAHDIDGDERTSPADMGADQIPQ